MAHYLNSAGRVTGAEPNLPLGQVNARLDEGLVMRVGIPHRGGKLAFHAFNAQYPAMVSANAFWNQAKGRFQFPECTDLSELDFALDSAGFTAMKSWKTKGAQPGMAGVFPWSYEAYVELASVSRCSWWSQPDVCCEPEVAANQAEIDTRLDMTATLLEGTLRVLYEWQNLLARTNSPRSVANTFKPPVPVIQGWSASDYLRSLDTLHAVWSRWEGWLAPPVLIGLGSVCRRTLRHPQHGLFAILAALEGRLPAGARLHLFGVKGEALNEAKMFDWIASADSMAYDVGARIKAHKAGTSNTVAHRADEMTRWMSVATRRMQPAAGDQFRLSLVS